jgi:uncharacterized protein YjdB
MHLRSVLFTSIAACGIASVACRGTDPIISDRCFVIVATIQPSSPAMHVGDTLRLHAAFTGPQACWPADTTAAALRWSAMDSTVRIDSLTGLVTALRVGTGNVSLRAVTGMSLNSTAVSVAP